MFTYNNVTVHNNQNNVDKYDTKCAQLLIE